MPPISTRTESENKLTVHRLSGPVSTIEVVDTLNQYYHSKQITQHVLWDLSEADLSDIGADDLLDIINTVKKYGSYRTGGKTALVGPHDLAFGLGRQFSIIGAALNKPFTTRVFRDYDQAIIWLMKGQ